MSPPRSEVKLLAGRSSDERMSQKHGIDGFGSSAVTGRLEFTRGIGLIFAGHKLASSLQIQRSVGAPLNTVAAALQL